MAIESLQHDSDKGVLDTLANVGTVLVALFATCALLTDQHENSRKAAPSKEPVAQTQTYAPAGPEQNL